MRQMMTAKVRPDAGKISAFSDSARVIAGSTAYCARDARFAVAQDARWSDPGPTTTGNPGNVV
jgi:hypothetical protein